MRRQRELWNQLTHETKLECGRLVGLSFFSTKPAEDKKKEQNEDDLHFVFSMKMKSNRVVWDIYMDEITKWECFSILVVYFMLM